MRIRSAFSPSSEIPETPTFLADPVGLLHPQVVVDDLAGGDGVAAGLGDRRNRDRRVPQRRQEQCHAVGPLGALLERRSAAQQQHPLRFESFRGPDLATPDPITAVWFPNGAGADRRRVRARVGFGDPEGDVQITVRHAGQVRAPHLLRAVQHHGVHPEDRQVHRRAPVHGRTGGGHLFEDHRRLVDPPPPASVGLRDGDADPTAVGHRGIELPGEFVSGVALRPVGVVKAGAHRLHRFADHFLVRIRGEVHALTLCGAAGPAPMATTSASITTPTPLRLSAL